VRNGAVRPGKGEIGLRRRQPVQIILDSLKVRSLRRRGDVVPATAPATSPARAFVKGPEFDNLSIYFNMDNGAGKVRGIYAQSNTEGAPLFKKWFEPFHDLGAGTVTLGNNGQTDHVSFDQIGLPGFQFIQDGLDYFARTHHTTADVYERVPPEDMKQAATILAAFLWDAANMDDRFPRKETGRAAP